MQTYLNRPELKTAFLAEITKHEQQDAFIKGSYGTMNAAQWQAYADWMTTNHLMSGHLDVSQAMTSSLLP